MLSILNENSKVYKKIVHEVLEIVFEHFMEVGSNLEYDEIYNSVFPLHKQDEEDRENQGLAFLKKLHMEIIDNFSHEFSPLKEYVTYYILLFVHEGSEGTFLLSDIIKESLNKEKSLCLDEDEIEVLNSINTPIDLINICFEDLDFLDIPEIFSLYKANPLIVTDFFHIDLDYYKELLPDDILFEYNQIKKYLALMVEKQSELEKDIYISKETELIVSKEHFYSKVDDLVNIFKHYIEHKKGHTLFNNTLGQTKEKQVQVLFNMIATLFVKEFDIVVSPEVDTGRGTVDFQLSKGAKLQALIEIKLGNHARYKDGLIYQLPTYLQATQVDYGFFLLVCYSQENYIESEFLQKTAEELSREYKKTIKFERIDASGSLKTASTIRKEEDIGFK